MPVDARGKSVGNGDYVVFLSEGVVGVAMDDPGPAHTLVGQPAHEIIAGCAGSPKRSWGNGRFARARNPDPAPPAPPNCAAILRCPDDKRTHEHTFRVGLAKYHVTVRRREHAGLDYFRINVRESRRDPVAAADRLIGKHHFAVPALFDAGNENFPDWLSRIAG